MVYRSAAKKTGALLAIAAALALVVTTFTQEDAAGPTGFAIGNPLDLSGGVWALFALGFFAGVLALGTYYYMAHHEARRQE